MWWLQYKYNDIMSVTTFFSFSMILCFWFFFSDLLSQTDPCTEKIKNVNCGGNETICRNTTADKRNYECACAEGFESYGTIYPISDQRTVIHKCQGR